MKELTEGQKARALVASITAHHFNVAKEFAAIDRIHEQSAARRSTTGIGSECRDKVKRAPDSIYDIAQRSPALAAILRKMQAVAYK